MDTITKEARSRNMSRIRSTDTKPELIIRKGLHKLGFRFRLCVKDLPGRPDIVLPKYKTIIFINGCFWHGHENCKRANIPKSNSSYWLPKILRNKERDKLNMEKLRNAGWKVLTVWECSLKTRREAEETIQLLAKQILSSKEKENES
ncbi:very short patch repair endonuclease [Turicimonas muris]|uniref:very short patch repair endonuclease n=1 Tax=Turicimonas muris TaxID=1796652 RepID=UPI002494129B|nr:very short patch repair endonuclease [Turicimonas muris]